MAYVIYNYTNRGNAFYDILHTTLLEVIITSLTPFILFLYIAVISSEGTNGGCSELSVSRGPVQRAVTRNLYTYNLSEGLVHMPQYPNHINIEGY